MTMRRGVSAVGAASVRGGFTVTGAISRGNGAPAASPACATGSGANAESVTAVPAGGSSTRLGARFRRPVGELTTIGVVGGVRGVCPKEVFGGSGAQPIQLAV